MVKRIVVEKPIPFTNWHMQTKKRGLLNRGDLLRRGCSSFSESFIEPRGVVPLYQGYEF